jgi:hypothetical protein
MARFAQNLHFAPVGALNLFAGARLRGWQAYPLPIASMAVTDPLRGGYSFFAPPFVHFLPVPTPIAFTATRWAGW